MLSMHTLGRVAAAALLVTGLSATAVAQDKVDPVKELKEALEEMRSAEELLAQSSREKAAVAQTEVDKILRKLLDDIELNQDGAAKKMLLGAEKAAVKIDARIQKILDSVEPGC